MAWNLGTIPAAGQPGNVVVDHVIVQFLVVLTPDHEVAITRTVHGMNLLAIDTSSVACSVALECGDNFYERHEEQAREHTRLLMPMIREVLDEAGIKSGEIDSIVLGNGPGSFIGMRIAASVAPSRQR